MFQSLLWNWVQAILWFLFFDSLLYPYERQIMTFPIFSGIFSLQGPDLRQFSCRRIDKEHRESCNMDDTKHFSSPEFWKLGDENKSVVYVILPKTSQYPVVQLGLAFPLLFQTVFLPSFSFHFLCSSSCDSHVLIFFCYYYQETSCLTLSLTFSFESSTLGHLNPFLFHVLIFQVSGCWTAHEFLSFFC